MAAQFSVHGTHDGAILKIRGTLRELREKPLEVPQEHRDGLSYLRWGSVDPAMARQNLAYLVTERSDGQLNYRSIAKALVGGYTGCVELRFRESAVATLTDDSIVEIQVCLARQAA